jgi:hypothetical protein
MLQKFQEQRQSIIDANKKKRNDKFYQSSKNNIFGRSIVAEKPTIVTLPTNNTSSIQNSTQPLSTDTLNIMSVLPVLTNNSSLVQNNTHVTPISRPNIMSFNMFQSRDKLVNPHVLSVDTTDASSMQNRMQSSSTGRPSTMSFNMLYTSNISRTSVDTNDVSSIQSSSIVTSRKIPLNIFQTWHTLDLPAKMKETVELLKKQNPEFTYYLYDDNMCRDFIQTHFDKDVVWAFDKLKPGAYKADLWRYCVLYIHGGVYLDIKYRCVNDFKLIQFTDREYWVKDRLYSIHSSIKPIRGVYQAYIVSLPQNNILLTCINHIIRNCRLNNYSQNDLGVTGPQLISNYMNSTDINNMKLSFDGNNILYNNKILMTVYREYRTEQTNTSSSYYHLSWLRADIFNYPILKYNNKYDFTRTIETQYGTMYSGTPNIIQSYDDKYIINLRWINYSYNSDGSKKYIPKQWISLNSRFAVDKNFKQVSKEVFLTEDFSKEIGFPGIGIEDIRTIKSDNKYFFLATRYNPQLKRTYVTSNEYIIDEEEYKLNKTYINPTFYDVNKIYRCEKNWAMFDYKSNLSIVYEWFPLRIGRINYDTCALDILETKNNMPEFFKNARGTTIGCTFNDEIWFILHKVNNNELYIPEHYTSIYPNTTAQKNTIYNYQHFFAVFDLDMNLKRYSELFKLGDNMVEFCTGLIMEETRLVLSYSLLDTESCVSAYDYDTIRRSIRWYKCVRLTDTES